MVPNLATEQRVVVDCVRRAFGQAGSTMGGATVDWELALDFAARQGLARLVHSGLAATGLGAPDRVQTKLRAQFLLASLHHETCLEPGLRRVLSALAARGLDSVVLKGAALAYLVYPNPADRTMQDVDLLLPSDQLERASAGLHQLGFRTSDADPPGPNHLRPLYSPDCRLSVELHHRLMIEPSPFVLDKDGMWARSRMGKIAGVEARVLAPPDALLHVCFHLSASHRYRSFPLRSLTDILAMTTCWQDEIDWALFLELVRRSRLAGAVYWPLHLSRLWLGASVPEFVLSELAPPAAIRKLVAPVTEPRFILEGQAPPGAASDTLYDVLLRLSAHTGCSPARQAWALIRGFFPPPEVTFAPASYTSSRARYAAYLLRPARIARGLDALGRFCLRLRRT